MIYKLMRLLVCCAALLFVSPVFSQNQACPVNINFSSGDLSFWSAKTGLVNGPSINYPAPNNGVSFIPEYSIPITGIAVIANPGTDLYGSFPTIPAINGYSYGYSIQIGSNATSYDLHSATANPGGFTRSVIYTINVPAGPVTTPYTMTYAYAMVLENGTHNSNEQPLFKATLSTPDSVITCASPQYYLPTFGNVGTGSTGATLDTLTALANGFTNSPVLFLSHAGQQGGGGVLLRDVWTKGWTEVTFDLSAYRGQQVKLTFETDNCAPGAHFAYAYVALRNTCAGLQISGPLVACTNSTSTYSIPALAGASYNWTVPPTWTINSGNNTNIINVTAGTGGGMITANEINSCANLKDTINVSTTPPTVAGDVNTDNTVCSGINGTILTLSGNTGGVLNWISSTDGGLHWNNISNVTNSYTAQNLTTTTQFKAVVQNGGACRIDTSLAATIVVDPKSVGGVLSPSNINICANQATNNIFTLTGNTGSVSNWQFSFNNTNWINFAPVKTDSTYIINSINATTYYRTVVKNGVCPADTSSVAKVNFINMPFPAATINPGFSSICYGKSATLNANISAGTNYTWSPANTLTNQGNGVVTGLPLTINAIATPPRTTNYVLTVTNAGCPNSLTDTFHLVVAPRIIVFAGNDTAIVANQPLQLNATVGDSSVYQFTWTPVTGLSSTVIHNPVATLGSEIDDITYIVRATNAIGCYGEDDIKVTVFKTGPEIFVPGAFTPNNDGLNDVIFPICVGIKQLNFFRIYNRWGQVIFSTSQIGKGWDGRIAGTLQGSNNFVFMVQGIDYLGHTIFKKGNIVLIR
jgi:gliding motility-associated-like protein